MKGQTERRRPTPEGAEHASGCLEDEITQALISLAFGRANDCVKLVLLDAPDLDALDLSLLAEVKRNDKGPVEVKLIDRIRALDGLLNAGSADSGCADAFFAAAGDDDAD